MTDETKADDAFRFHFNHDHDAIFIANIIVNDCNDKKMLTCDQLLLTLKISI